METRVQVVMYTRPGCHLCDEMKEAIGASGCAGLYNLEEVDIESEADVESALGYYLVYPEEKRRLPSIVAFRAWLLELCAASSQGAEQGAPKPARKRPMLPARGPHR